MLYTKVSWPESQQLMNEEWFEECVLDHSEDAAYFVPVERLGIKMFTLETVLDLLASMQQGLTPFLFEDALKKGERSTLGPEDFIDLPGCKSIELGIEEEFNEYLHGLPNYMPYPE